MLGMVRACVHLTERELMRLRKHAKTTGLSVAELVRRAVDDWLDRTDNPRKETRWQRKS